MKRAPKARGRAPTTKRAPKCGDCVGGPVEELPMKTRPDGSAFRRSNVAYGRQPTQPRPRNDGFHWATPRHPEKSKLTVCNWFAYFTLTNFGGRKKCHTERSREYLRGSAHIKPFSNYVIARHRLRYKYSNDNGFLIVHARVPWQSPERVPLVCNYLLQLLSYRW